MYFLIILFPFLSFIICSLFGRKIGIHGSKIIANFLLCFTTLISYIIFIEIIINNSIAHKWLLSGPDQPPRGPGPKEGARPPTPLAFSPPALFLGPLSILAIMLVN